MINFQYNRYWIGSQLLQVASSVSYCKCYKYGTCNYSIRLSKVLTSSVVDLRPTFFNFILISPVHVTYFPFHIFSQQSTVSLPSSVVVLATSWSTCHQTGHPWESHGRLLLSAITQESSHQRPAWHRGQGSRLVWPHGMTLWSWPTQTAWETRICVLSLSASWVSHRIWRHITLKNI